MNNKEVANISDKEEGEKIISGIIVRQLFYKNSEASSEAEEYIINTSEKYFTKNVYFKKTSDN